MIAYSVRTTPWTILVIGSGVVAGLLALVARWPWSMWPLQGTAVGVLAGVAAWALDERAASIVDSVPRPHWWRTVARALIVVPVLLTVWTGGLVLSRGRLPEHLGLFVVQGAVAVTGALAVTAWRRSGGVAEPGTAVAASVIPTAAALALIRPLADRLPVFPVWEGERWGLSWALWLAAGGLAAVTLVVTLAGDRRA